jgi:hypothetical protein
MRAPSRSTSARICTGEAPSAERTPISRVRRATANAATP